MKNIALLVAVAAVLSGCGKSESTAESASAQVPEPAKAAAVPPPPPVPTKWDGPFGLAEGLTVEQLEKAGISLKARDTGIYSSSTAPSPNSKFETYTYIISDKTGLCKVAGIGRDIEANSFGAQVQDVFDELETALTAKYGKPGHTNKFVLAGSIWKESKYWMMGLSKEERHHSVTWLNGQKGVSLPSLESISLKAGASDIATGYVTLNYEFQNVSVCLAAIKAKSNDSL